jgi:hypothetical protein
VRERPGGIVSTLLWVTDETPADMSGRADRAERTIGIPPPARGSIFRIVDFPPVGEEIKAIGNADYQRAMGIEPVSGAPARHPYTHRTKSIDYAIVLAGEPRLGEQRERALPHRLHPDRRAGAAGAARVGWVERSETHHLRGREQMGFASAQPILRAREPLTAGEIFCKTVGPRRRNAVPRSP